MVETTNEVKAEEELLAARMSEVQEKLDDLENRVELLEIIAKKEAPETQIEETQSQVKKVIQINAKGKKYFCTTPLEQQIFSENNPGVKTETYTLELPVFIVDKYLNDPENKKQFTKKKEQILSETPKKLDWLHQAHRLGIPTDSRTKEDILAEIAASKQIPAITSVS